MVTKLFLKQLTKLAEVSYQNNEEAIIKLVSKIVPTYRYSPYGNGLDTKSAVYKEQVRQINE